MKDRMFWQNDTELVEYNSVTEMADQFEKQLAVIFEGMRQIEEATKVLNAVFDPARSHLEFCIRFSSEPYGNFDHNADQIRTRFKLRAWRMIIDKIGIRRVMSSKRQRDLDDVLEGKSSHAQLPEVSAENINGVIEGYVASAQEFLEEAIHEEYDYFRPRMAKYTRYKTNKKNVFKLDEKLVVEYALDAHYSRFQTCHNKRSHLTALDNIFHILDGRGCIHGCHGPLVDTIHASEDGTGETSYFKFRCYRNRSLHMKILRKDLLNKFNAICGRNRLPSEENS